MTTKHFVILVKILEAVVTDMKVTINNILTPINFVPGRSSQIMKKLNDFDNSETFKGLKYPLTALPMPVKIQRSGGHYGITRIERIIIATLTNSTDDVLTRYQTGGTFQSILYPCYYEFFNALARSTSIVGEDPDMFNHTVLDNPGTQPIGQGSQDFIDSLEILNLELTLTQLKTC